MRRSSTDARSTNVAESHDAPRRTSYSNTPTSTAGSQDTSTELAEIRVMVTWGTSVGGMPSPSGTISSLGPLPSSPAKFAA